MSSELTGSSESSHRVESFTDDGDRGRRYPRRVVYQVEPASTKESGSPSNVTNRLSEVETPSDVSGPEYLGSPPVRRLSDFDVELIGLVGTKVPALLIPADSSRPITKIEFD
jgi:hypothetical protein